MSKNVGMTYTSKVKSDPELMDLEKNVSRIRRSQKGDLMQELKMFSGKTAGKVAESLWKGAQVRANKQEIVKQCKGIDKIDIKEDIREALGK